MTGISILNKTNIRCAIFSVFIKKEKMKNKSFIYFFFVAIKTFKHFICKTKSLEKGWIQSDLDIPRVLFRSKAQRRVLFF